MDMNLTVSEFMFHVESELEVKAEDSDYWQNSYDFVKENADKLISELSPKQRQWLFKIEETLS